MKPNEDKPDLADLFTGMGGIEIDMQTFQIEEMRCVRANNGNYLITLRLSSRQADGDIISLVFGESKIVWFPITEYISKISIVNNKLRKLSSKRGFTLEIVDRHGGREVAIIANSVS